MSAINKFARAASGQIVCFFKQTFRRHTGEEYSEFLTRGVRRDDEGVQRAYPWFYIRLFAACIILLAVYLLIMRFTPNALFSPVTVIIASLAFNVPFLILLYEIYPRNDLSLLSVFVTLLIGGTGACVLTQILYSVIPAQNAWLSALRAAGVEEVSKAAAVIITLASLRCRQPLVGFIMGAAVGCGFSIVEDAGYIFVYSNELYALNISSLISVFVDRGLTAFCTHTVWTASIGWAFASAHRPFLSFRLYACLIGAVLLHFLWNSPLSGGAQVAVIVFCVLAAAAFGITALALSRRATLTEAGESATPQFFHTDEGSLVRDRLYYTHAGHLSLTFGAFVMAVLAIIYCSIPFRETYYAQTFNDKADFINFMQSGYELTQDLSRAYDEDGGIYSSQSTDGVVTSVTQKVSVGGFDYYYEYTVAGGGEAAIYFINSVSVELDIGGVTSRYFTESVYNLDGTLYATYFRVRGDVTGLNVSADTSEVTVILYDPLFEFDYSRPQYVVLFAALGGLAGLSLGLYILFYILARRKNNAR